MGGAVGLAILSTLANDRTNGILQGLTGQPTHARTQSALVQGFQLAFFVAAGLSAAGVEGFSRDRGFFEAAGDRCATDPRFHDLRQHSLGAMGRLLRRAQEAGAVRTDLAPSDLGFLIGSAAYATSLPVTELHPDVWKRYLRVILDGMRPEGASRLRPGAPKI